MDISTIGKKDFNGLTLEASFIGRKTIRGEYCDCFQPGFDDCTLIRCEPCDGSGIFFINAINF